MPAGSRHHSASPDRSPGRPDSGRSRLHHVASMPAGLHGERVTFQRVGPCAVSCLAGYLDMQCKASPGQALALNISDW